MGFQSLIQSAVGNAFDTIGDLKETMDYIHEGQEPDYSTTTGLVTPDTATVTLTVRAMLLALDNPAASNLPGDLIEVSRPGDMVALIPGEDITIEPTTGDKLTRLDETWVVKGFAIDPAGGLWKMIVKRVGGGADGVLVFHE